MSQRDGIFAGEDPFELARTWLEEAKKSEPNDPNAAALATSDATALPNVRMVLLKDIEDDAFVFYTNYTSAKGQELTENPQAAMVLHWKSLRRQLRIRGAVTKEEGAKADAYFASRHPDSRVGAWASRQSQPLSGRDELMQAVEDIRNTIGSEPTRPDFWGGFRIKPIEIEFWAEGENRLHDRFHWKKAPDSGIWKAQRLNP